MDDLQKALVEVVKNYACANYEMDGWDYIVECFSDEDILEAIKHAKTDKAAIRAVGRLAKELNERRKDVQGEIF